MQQNTLNMQFSLCSLPLEDRIIFKKKEIKEWFWNFHPASFKFQSFIWISMFWRTFPRIPLFRSFIIYRTSFAMREKNEVFDAEEASKFLKVGLFPGENSRFAPAEAFLIQYCRLKENAVRTFKCCHISRDKIFVLRRITRSFSWKCWIV